MRQETLKELALPGTVLYLIISGRLPVFKGQIALDWPCDAQPIEKIQHFSAFFPVGIGQIY